MTHVATVSLMPEVGFCNSAWLQLCSADAPLNRRLGVNINDAVRTLSKLINDVQDHEKQTGHPPMHLSRLLSLCARNSFPSTRSHVTQSLSREEGLGTCGYG
jgi:hypothetical protein